MTNQDRKITDNPQNENNLTIAENSDDKKDANQNTQSNEVVEGVYIPAIELPDSSDIGAAAMPTKPRRAPKTAGRSSRG